MTKLTHAQFKEYLDGLENETRLCLDGKSSINLTEECCIALISAFIAAKGEFNKVPDIATELENILLSELKRRKSKKFKKDAVSSTEFGVGTLFGIEQGIILSLNKLKELRGE